jgi:ATP-dependent RNA helicase RhlB
MRLLLGILEREKPESAIIFCNTKRYTEIVAKRLRINGYECEFIIGDLPQSKRLSVIENVKAGKVHFLIATDVAARGLDIEGLAMVVNYDLPVEAENYVHRIGRTARAGKTGKAITLASEQDVYELTPIERYIGKKIPAETAVEELFAADKSENMRIHADFYEVRRENRDGSRRDGSHSSGRGELSDRGRRDRPHSEHTNRSRGEGRGGENRRPSPAKRPNKTRIDTHTTEQASAAGEDQANKDFSRLSFDERMAVYKKKYKGSSPQAARESQNSQNSSERGQSSQNQRPFQERGQSSQKQGSSQAPGNRKPGQNQSPQRPNSRGQSSRNPQQQERGQSSTKSSSAQQSAIKQQVQQQNAKSQPGSGDRAVSKPAKKGLFSRLIGIFKKD